MIATSKRHRARRGGRHPARRLLLAVAALLAITVVGGVTARPAAAASVNLYTSFTQLNFFPDFHHNVQVTYTNASASAAVPGTSSLPISLSWDARADPGCVSGYDDTQTASYLVSVYSAANQLTVSQPVHVKWDCGSGGGTITIGAGAPVTLSTADYGVVTVTPQPATVSFTANQTGTATVTAAVSIAGVNHAPVAVLSEHSVTLPTTIGTYGFGAAASYDPDGDPLTYTWSGSIFNPPVVNAANGISTRMPTVPGTYTVIVTVSDGSLSSSDTDTITLVDGTPPVVSAAASPSAPDGSNGWYRSPVSVTWSAVDNDSTVTSTSGCDPVSVSGDQPFTTYTCSATSGGGTTTDSIQIGLDATLPTIAPAVSPASPDGASGWYVTAPTVSWSCGDATSGVASCSAASTLGESATPQTVTGQAADNAGNTASATTSGLLVDLSDPTLTCVDASPFTFGATGQVSATVADAISGPAQTTVSAAVDTSTAGDHTVVLTGADNAGRAASVTCAYTVINPLPVVTVDAGGPVDEGATATLSASFTGTADAASVDWGDGSAPEALGAVTSPFTATHVYAQDGTYTATVTVSNAAGDGAATGDVVVENVAPAIGGPTVSPATVEAGDAVTLDATVSDPGTLDVVSASIDWGDGSAAETLALGAGGGAVHATHVYPGDALGDHTVTLTATDDAGASSAATATATVQDTIAPAAAPAQDPPANAAGWNHGAVTVDWGWSDGGSGIDPSACTLSSTADAATQGEVTLDATCADRAGNIATAEVTVQIDSVAPAITVTGPIDGATYLVGQPATVDFACTDGGSGVDACDGSLASGTPLPTGATGDGSLTVTATDAAGNTTSTTVSYHVVTAANLTPATVPPGYTAVEADCRHTVIGTPGDDVIFAPRGNCRIVDTAGNNVVLTGRGNDRITLGAGNDVVIDQGGNNVVDAGAGANDLTLGRGNNRVTALDGDTSVVIAGGNNVVRLGTGSDRVTTGDGNDRITTGNGSNVIDAGGGNNVVESGNGGDRITTGRGNDRITTGGGADVIHAGDGNNVVTAGGGDDAITAGAGNDRIDGGAGQDACDAGGGHNVVRNCEGPGSQSGAAHGERDGSRVEGHDDSDGHRHSDPRGDHDASHGKDGRRSGDSHRA